MRSLKAAGSALRSPCRIARLQAVNTLTRQRPRASALSLFPPQPELRQSISQAFCTVAAAAGMRWLSDLFAAQRGQRTQIKHACIPTSYSP